MGTVTSKDGTQIAFDRRGGGPAVILVGGAFQYREIDPRTTRLAELLAQDFTVFHYDRRGRGMSGDTLPYAVDREVEDLAALLQEAGGSASVFAMSSGGSLALTAACSQAIQRLALYEPPFIVNRNRPAVPSDYVPQLNTMIAEGRRGDAVEYFMTQAVGMPAEYIAPMRSQPFWTTFEAVGHTLPYDGLLMGDTQSGSPEPLKQWSSVRIPTLVLDGEASPGWIHDAAQALIDVLPDARRRTLPGQTHEYDPEMLYPVLKEFFYEDLAF